MQSWLTGWKRIAEHIDCHIKTAINYHKQHGMPVRRGPNNKPIALPDELDKWLVGFAKKSESQGDEKAP